MPYQYIEAPDDTPIKNEQSIFLAGGISDCKDWQKEVSKELKELDNLTVLNPRRENFEVFKSKAQFSESAKQIAWEYEKLRTVSQILFWFTDETVQPITLYELGATLERNAQYFNKTSGGQKIFLGVDANYDRVFDVHIQAKLKGYSDAVADNLEYLIAMVKIYNKNLEMFKGEE